MNIRIGPIFLCVIFFTLSRVSVIGQKPRACCEKYCYDTDDVRPQEEFYCSKTSYFIGKGEEIGNDFQVPSKVDRIDFLHYLF